MEEKEFPLNQLTPQISYMSICNVYKNDNATIKKAKKKNDTA